MFQSSRLSSASVYSPLFVVLSTTVSFLNVEDCMQSFQWKLLVGWVHGCLSFHKKTINQLTAKLYFCSALYLKRIAYVWGETGIWLQHLSRFSSTKPTEDWCRTWAVSHNCCYSYSVSFSRGHLCVYSSFSFSCVFYARWSRHRGRVLFELRLHFPHHSLHRQSKVNNKKSKIQFIYSQLYFPKTLFPQDSGLFQVKPKEAVI